MTSHERLLQAVGGEWETTGTIAARARVNRYAAGQMLARLARDGQIDSQHDPASGNWTYRARAGA